MSTKGLCPFVLHRPLVKSEYTMQDLLQMVRKHTQPTPFRRRPLGRPAPIAG